jgi:hypothetical protein
MGVLTDRELEDLRKSAAEATDMLEGRKSINFVSTGAGKTTKDFIREHVEIYERVLAALNERQRPVLDRGEGSVNQNAES